MSIIASELKFFQSAQHAEADTGTQGGAIAAAGKVEFTDISAADNVEALSDGADTRNFTIYGRKADGSIANETIALTGATPIVTANVYERVLKCSLATSDGTRTVTVRKATGDVTIGTMEPNITSFRRLFYDASSGPAQKIFFEKIFAKNTNATLSLTSAAIKLTADPATVIRVGCAPSVDDSATTTNRLTAPGSVAFVDDNVSQNVPGNVLAAGSAIGIWVEMTLAADDTPKKNTLTIQLSGNTV